MIIKKSDFNTKMFSTLFNPNVGSSHKGDRFVTYVLEMNKLFVDGDFDLGKAISTIDFKSDIVKISNYEYLEIDLNRISCLGMMSLNGDEKIRCFIDIHPSGVENIFYISIMITSTGYTVNGVYKV